MIAFALRARIALWLDYRPCGRWTSSWTAENGVSAKDVRGLSDSVSFAVSTTLTVGDEAGRGRCIRSGDVTRQGRLQAHGGERMAHGCEGAGAVDQSSRRKLEGCGGTPRAACRVGGQ